MAKRSPEELWRQLAGEAGDDPVDRAASVSVAQAERELGEAGFDVAAERAKADALLAEIEAGTPASGQVVLADPKNPGASGHGVPIARGKTTRTVAPSWWRPRRTWWVAGAAAAAVVAALAIPTAVPVTSPPPPKPQPPAQHAAALRREALAACDAQRYRECAERLDEARSLDPEGERAPEVMAARRLLQGVPHEP
jgi:hypothetical protein